jgi:hypothetical protein
MMVNDDCFKQKQRGEHITGWGLSPTHLKNDGVKVSWDDYIPIYGK